ncbi:hypothetical protein AC249_AIPGENE28764 [Exaiptasia diaphana]|nr:hypothetical protein AC249_AIPGENE28764 [Exaiptasia diaphana]
MMWMCELCNCHKWSLKSSILAPWTGIFMLYVNQSKLGSLYNALHCQKEKMLGQAIHRLQEFRKINAVPLNIDTEVLNQGQGVEQTLYNKKAKWHNTCRNSFSNDKLDRAKKRKLLESDDEVISTEVNCSPIKARRSSLYSLQSSNQCFFCELNDDSKNLHLASTLEVDEKVRSCASLTSNSRLIGKLASGDMIATEAKYHLKCLVNLYNQARKESLSSTGNTFSSSFQPTDTAELAFAELVAFIDESLQDEEATILTLSDFVTFYSSKLSELKGEEVKTNSTRLKNKILAAFPDLTAHTQGREVMIVISQIGGVLLEAKKEGL